MAPALTLLATDVLPGLLPCGPGGHAVVPRAVADAAGKAWIDGGTAELGAPRELGTADLPGGAVLFLAHDTGGRFAVDHEQRHAWALGLAWLRLGLSEALRETCVHYLRGRIVGTSVLLQQQLVKGAIADALAEQLEIRAVLMSGPDGGIDRVQAQITRADRGLVRLLGASGYLTGSAGQVADVSEVLAEAYLRPEE
ncbi:MAG TPA: DUF2786 domain-containing protein [Pseudonocardiaceae bacterium]|jgi:hypothetical protein|nr:DUF2786 domain-containing protein [Pseudonocardiaceae bacterium]